MSFGRCVRVSLASVILLTLAAFAVFLTPVYYRNLRFARALGQLASRPGVKADSALRAIVVERAARLGLPVRYGDVALRGSRERLRIEVNYQVPVDLPLYSVSLHFHPVGGK
jgi:hypothetical protein